MKKTLILVDGSSYLYRAFHAMPSFTNSKGFPTGAIYGIVNMLKKLLADYDPEYIAVVFDAKGKTFRDELYEPYKANRSEMPKELIQQIEPIHAIIEKMGLPILMIEGVEADDVIGTLAKQAKNFSMDTLISTGDKDLAQLVDDNITLVNTMTGTILNPQTVNEKFGVPPHLIIDYLALVGDSVDNIPGIPQVGPKTAVKWLVEYGSLDNIVNHASEIKGKVGENLRASLSQLPLAKTLATIKLDVSLDIDITNLKRHSFDKEALIKFYQEFEFKSWLSELLENGSITSQEKHTHYETIVTQTELEKWIKELENTELFAFSIKTTSLNYMDAKIVGISFAIAPGKAVYIPLAHHDITAPTELNLEKTLQQLAPLLENPAKKKFGHNIKHDMEILANYRIHLNGIVYDTMLESYILDSTSTKHDSDSLALKYLGLRATPLEEVIGKGAKQISFDQAPVSQASAYAAENIDVILQLHQTLWPKLVCEPGLKYIFENIEMPLIQVLACIERNGVLIDTEKLNKQSVELQLQLDKLEQQIFHEAQTVFNLNSPKQLQEILYTNLKLPILQKTPGGQPSTADAVLQELALEYSLPKYIIEYRALTKLMTTYINRLPQQINSDTKRIHTSYNQTGAGTGRLSSSDPNLQNIPVRTKEGRRIRQAFIAPKGYKIVSADYSQIELRIMAHLSNDPGLLKAFEQNLDIHAATAAEVLGIPLAEVTSEERRNAKAINFGLIYGMSAFGLAKQLGLDRQTAQNYIEKYFARYPGVKFYMENTREKAKSQGYVETLWGRRLYVPDINSSQFIRQKAAERAAINAPLQGTAADIIKRAMIEIDTWLQQKNIDAKMIMQVHDELVFEVAENEIDQAFDGIRSHMMSAAQLKVPLNVSIGAGDNWDSASGH